MSDSRDKMRLLQRQANEIAGMILSTALPKIDILLAIERLRDLCEELFPGRGELFEMIYESRFERLWEQFGNDRPDDVQEEFPFEA